MSVTLIFSRYFLHSGVFEELSGYKGMVALGIGVFISIWGERAERLHSADITTSYRTDDKKIK
jgi:hypothetical protein